MAVLDEFNKINDDFGLPEVYENADKMEQLMDRQALLQDKMMHWVLGKSILN
jgi:hypothetical protein